MNDVFTMSPFGDAFWRVAPRVSGDDLAAVLGALGALGGNAVATAAPLASDAGAPRRGPRAHRGVVASGALPPYATTLSSEPAAGETYELWTLDFDLPAVVAALEAQTGDVAAPERVLPGTNDTSVWLSFVPEFWPCGGGRA